MRGVRRPRMAPLACLLGGVTLLTGCSGALGGAGATTPAKVTPLTATLPPLTANPVSPPMVAPYGRLTSSPAASVPGSGSPTVSPGTFPEWCFPNGFYNAYYANGLGVPALTVRPGPGTAEVSWWSTGDPAIMAYKIAAVPTWVVKGTQPPLDWQTVAPTLTCRPVAIQLNGLARNRSYEIWVDVVLRTAQPAVGRDVMASRSPVFRTS